MSEQIKEFEKEVEHARDQIRRFVISLEGMIATFDEAGRRLIEACRKLAEVRNAALALEGDPVEESSPEKLELIQFYICPNCAEDVPVRRSSCQRCGTKIFTAQEKSSTVPHLEMKWDGHPLTAALVPDLIIICSQCGLGNAPGCGSHCVRCQGSLIGQPVYRMVEEKDSTQARTPDVNPSESSTVEIDQDEGLTDGQKEVLAESEKLVPKPEGDNPPIVRCPKAGHFESCEFCKHSIKHAAASIKEGCESDECEAAGGKCGCEPVGDKTQ